MKNEKKYQTPVIEIIDIPDDIVTTSTFGDIPPLETDQTMKSSGQAPKIKALQ